MAAGGELPVPQHPGDSFSAAMTWLGTALLFRSAQRHRGYAQASTCLSVRQLGIESDEEVNADRTSAAARRCLLR